MPNKSASALQQSSSALAPATAENWNELVDLLRRIPEEFITPQRRAIDSDTAADAYRLVSHILQSALLAHAEFDPDRPRFERIVSPTRKFTGDNPDAVYFEAEVSPDRCYRVTGNLAGAAYTSFTVEGGAAGGAYPTRTCGALNDADIDISDDGGYELRLGGPPLERNWMELPEDAGRITTRHYFERAEPAAADQTLAVPVTIEATDPPEAPPRSWDDVRAAAMLRRVITHVRGKTLDQPLPGATSPSWVSRVPNKFPTPERPGDIGLSAFDAHYSMAPYALAPDEALVIRSRWPKCRFGSVCLWNLHLQTYDYVNRSVSRNRANTALEPDGSFRMVLAHQDPGAANWLDTEGRRTGIVMWRFFCAEGGCDSINAEVVKLTDVMCSKIY